MIRLTTLGPTDLKRSSGEELRPILVQPKRLALLVYLAVEASDRFVRRDSLLPLFWPEFDQPKARQALRSALYFLRQHLGDGVLTGRGNDEVGVSTAVLGVDLADFAAAAERGDAEAALGHYRGDFLQGLHVPDGSAELDQWAERIRQELRRQAAHLAWRLAVEAETRANAARAALWGRRAFEIEADDEASLRRLMEMLDRLGDPGGALRVFEEFAARLLAELGVAASAETRGLAARLRVKRPTPGPMSAIEAPPGHRPSRPTPEPATSAPPPTASPGRPRRRLLQWALIASPVVVSLLLLTLALRLGRSSGARPVEGLEGPVVVVPLHNETGDSSLAIWGRYAGDWITQGLQAIGRLPVVPWRTALRASQVADSVMATGETDPVAVLRRETGAGTVITGSYYRVGDSVRFRADINNASTGRVLWSVPAIAASPDSVQQAIGELRSRLLGGVGLASDPRFASNPRIGRDPPRFAAFEAYDRGQQLFSEGRYSDAATEYERAFRIDSTFYAPALGALTAYWNSSRYDRVESLARLLAVRRADLTEPQDLELRWTEARLAGDGPASLEVRRRAAVVAPSTINSYNLALLALQMGRPTEALAALEPLRANEPYVSRWAPFWIYLSHANHMLGRYDAALSAARELRRRFARRPSGLSLEVATLAALGQVAAIDSTIAAADVPGTSYWSEGAALVVAGQELSAHGFADRGPEYFDRAIVWLERQLRVDSGSAGQQEWLLVALYSAGRVDEAERLARRLDTATPDRLLFRTIGALVLARRGDSIAARRHLGERPERDRGSFDGALARLAAVGGDREGAAAHLRAALELGIESFPWAHSDWWIDFRGLPADSRARQLLAHGVE